jgi:hypothetical protein
MTDDPVSWLEGRGSRPLLKQHAMKLFYVALVLGSQCAYGATTGLTPRIAVGEIYTDNIGLDNEDEKSKFITQVTPSVNASFQGARLRGDLDYEFQAYFYGSDHSSAHQLDAFANAELYRDVFFVDADANVFQSVIDPQETTALDNLNESNNRTNVLTANVSPYWQQRFGDSTVALARYRYGIVDYDKSDENGDLEDSTVQAGSLSVGNLLDVTRRWTWQLAYDYTRIAYDDDDTDTLRSARATLGYRLSAKVQLIADVGDDNNDFESENTADTSGFFWNAGIKWDPNSKNHLEAGTGQRYDGNVYNFLWRRRASNATMEFSYAQTLDSNSNVLLEEQVPVGSETVSRFRSDGTVFERKLFRASSTITLSKSIFDFAYSNERRDNQDTGDEDEYNSFSGAWDYGFSARTSFSLKAFLIRQDFGDTNQNEDLGRVTAGFDRRIGPKTRGAVLYSHTRQNSDDETNEYRENRVWVTLSREF